MVTWLFVALGGAIGAISRFALSGFFPSEAGKFPVATFTANILGCFIMGVLYVVVMDKQLIPISWRPFLMVGFLGAFTTFSTFSLEALSLWQTQHYSVAVSYVVASLVLTLLAVWTGYSVSEILFK